MCLILFAYQVHPRYPLVVAANRDEFYQRPTQSSHFWESGILAGKDLQSGGTWLGVNPHGNLAAVTNYRAPGLEKPDAPSRGHLVTEFLEHNLSVSQFQEQLQATSHFYNGFNLLFGNWHEGFCCHSNQNRQTEEIAPGYHALSNRFLNSPWPKVEKGKEQLQQLLEQKDSLDGKDVLPILQDTKRPPDEELPDTGVGKELERLLSPIFIKSESYGTRASTVILVTYEQEVYWTEQNYEQGQPTTILQYQLRW